jgi:hypothetical protein
MNKKCDVHNILPKLLIKPEHMKTIYALRSKMIRPFGCLVTMLLLNSTFLNGQSFRLFAVSDLKRVFEDGYNLPPATDTIKVFGIRGEVLSGQCAFQARNNMTNITVELSPIKNQVSGNSLPVEAARWDFVGSIPLKENAPNQPESALERRAPARFPDYLMEERQVNVNKGAYQSVWLTITIPENAEAGNYSGTVKVRSVQGEQSLPLKITIFPLTLPAERHLKVTEWYSTHSFETLHGIQGEYSDAWFEMLRKYAENMAAHRQNIFEVPMSAIAITKSKTGELEFDFSRFDQIAQVFWDTKKMDYLETGEIMKFEEDWSSTKILPKDFRVKNPETGEKTTISGKDVIPYLLPALENHLRQKGWLGKTLFHIKDEPSVYNAPSWRDMSAYIHKYAPDLKRMDAIETSYIISDIEIACPQIDHLGTWYEDFKQQALRGTELWIYTVGIYQASSYPNKTIDLPVIGNRVMHWVNYEYDLTGFLHWGWNQWTEDPYKEVGMHIGDGWHVYPSKNGVLNSLRWEQMRNGIQDYEYFRMLEEKIKALKDSLGYNFAWIDPKRRGKEIAGKVVMGLAKYTNDPQVIYNAKMEVIRELIDFDISPRIYAQINPEVNTILKSGSTVEIYGWAEPETKVLVNDREVPVNKQGLFLGIIDMTTKSTFVTITATNKNGSKKIVRDFAVED